MVPFIIGQLEFSVYSFVHSPRNAMIIRVHFSRVYSAMQWHWTFAH